MVYLNDLENYPENRYSSNISTLLHKTTFGIDGLWEGNKQFIHRTVRQANCATQN